MSAARDFLKAVRGCVGANNLSGNVYVYKSNKTIVHAVTRISHIKLRDRGLEGT